VTKPPPTSVELALLALTAAHSKQTGKPAHRADLQVYLHVALEESPDAAFVAAALRGGVHHNVALGLAELGGGGHMRVVDGGYVLTDAGQLTLATAEADEDLLRTTGRAVSKTLEGCSTG
jgi:hypothetical protein